MLKNKTTKNPRHSGKKYEFLDRELSWLSFNERVLFEANDQTVPLMERLKFLAIFSNNLDEFFRVRVATLRRLVKLKLNNTEVKQAKSTLQKIKKTVLKQQIFFNKIFHDQLLPQLQQHNVFLVDDTQLTPSEKNKVYNYFKETIENRIFPIVIDPKKPFPGLQDGRLYLAISMQKEGLTGKRYALISIPVPLVNRFYVIPSSDAVQKVILLEDIIKSNLTHIFSSLNYTKFTAHVIKLTRDAEIDIDYDIGTSLLDKVKKSLHQRKLGSPTRFIYDENIQADLLLFLTTKLKIDKEGAIPGGKIHNFRDFMNFPKLDIPDFYYPKFKTLQIPELENDSSVFSAIRHEDLLLAYPYHSFNYVIKFLREAAIDPNVDSIKICLYRLGQNSAIANALINAVRNGKTVTAITELRARFMEEHNIYWAQRLREEGINVMEGIPNYKIHAKIILISRREKNKKKQLFAHVGTGNFNEDTTNLYCDFSLLTCKTRICNEVAKVFDMIEDFHPAKYRFNNLWVSPVNTRKRFIELLQREITFARKGKPARAIIKINNVVDEACAEQILKAASEGVVIDMIVRGICILPVTANHPNIRIISIVDKFLEHARVFYFENGGKSEVYIGSADLMQRNIQFRVEVVTPILEKKLKKKLKTLLECQLKENVKARIIEKDMKNNYVQPRDNSDKMRSQEEFFHLV